MFTTSKLINPPVPTELEEATAAVEAAEAVLAEAQARKDAANARCREIQLEEIKSKYQSAFEEMLAKPDEAFVAANPSFDVRPYILPFGREYGMFNPLDDADRAGHEFGPDWTANMTAIICKKNERSRPTRLIWTSGYVSHESDFIGRRFQARHDQTGGNLGKYQIVGLAFFGPDAKLARTVGEVPDRKIAQSTYK